ASHRALFAHSSLSLPPYSLSLYFPFFFFHDPATTEIYTLSLHDALPICADIQGCLSERLAEIVHACRTVLENTPPELAVYFPVRSEEHTSELQSRFDLVCRLLLEKKKKKHKTWKDKMTTSNKKREQRHAQ